MQTRGAYADQGVHADQERECKPPSPGWGGRREAEFTQVPLTSQTAPAAGIPRQAVSNVRKGIKFKVLKQLRVPRGFAWGDRDFFPNRGRHPRFGVQIVTFIRDLKFNTLANLFPRGFLNSGWHPRFEQFSGLNRGWRPRFKYMPYRHSLSRWRTLF